MSDQKVGRIEFGPSKPWVDPDPWRGVVVAGSEPRIRVQPHDELGALADEVARLRQGLWDVYRILGFDTDGNETPVSLASDIVKLVVDSATEFRRDTDEDAKALTAEIKALRQHYGEEPTRNA